MMSNQSSSSLDYQTHTNLSINIKTADECENLSEIRYEIDTIDHFIVKLMHTRMKYALATLKFKLDGKPIPDNQRIIQQLKQRKIWAKQYELDQNFIESFFKLMIDWYMTQQIKYYQNKKPDQLNLQIKFYSLAQLKAMEFGLDWINVSQYDQLISSAYRKATKLNEPILVSFTQKTSIFLDNHSKTNIHPFTLFEHAHRLSITNAFILTKPSQQMFILTLGSVQHFDINQNIYSSNTKLKQIVNKNWKHLLSNAIIQSSAQNNFPGNGPILTGGLSFDQQKSCQSNKWSNFNQTQFVLPRIQFNSKDNETYVTFNTIIMKYDKIDYDISFIDKEIISLLQFCNQLFNHVQQYSDKILNFPFNCDNHTQINEKLKLSSDIWKQTIYDAIQEINNGNLEKIVLAREIEIKNDQQNIICDLYLLLTRLYSTYSSSYIYGILKEETCFIGATSDQLLQLFHDQLQCIALTCKIIEQNNKIEDILFQTKLFNSQKQQQHQHSLIVDWINKKINSISQENSIVISDKTIDQQYLCTSIQSTIQKEITFLDLLEIMHPTPAVTGFPLSNSLKFIEENENLDRGWFMAPIGWIDANGNGQFITALKSILINKDLITLFTNCTIIDGSNTEEKLQETNSNIKTILLMFHDKQLEQE